MASKLYEIAFKIGGKISASFPQSLKGAAGKLDEVSKKIAKLEGAQGQVSRFRQLHREIDATKLKLAQAEAEVKHLGSTMGPMTADMARKLETAKGSAEKLRLELRGQVTELGRVKTAMEAAGVSQKNMRADSARIGAQLAASQKVQKLMQLHQGAVLANQKARDAAKTSFSESKSKLLGAAAGVAVVALPAVVAAKFEDSMARVGALSHATDEELAKLTETADILGRDTRFSGIQAAEGMRFLAQSGFKVSELLGAMPGMLDIAAAGMVDVGEASDITSNILRGFGMQAGQTGRLGDVLTNAFTNSNTTLSLLGETMKYVAPVARSTGLSLEKTAAAAGVLANAGIKGEMAGTAMRAMLSRLSAPPKKARDALASLGVKVMDAKKNMLPLDEILGSLNKKMAKFGTGSRQGKITDIFGMEAATAATVLLAGQASGALAEMTTKVAKSGTAAAIAAKMNATAAGQLDNLKGSVESLSIKLGNVLIPMFKSTVDKVVPIINSISAWAKEHPRLTEVLVVGAGAVASLNFALATSGAALNGIRLGLLTAQGAMLKFQGATAAGMAASGASVALVAAGVAGLASIGYQLYRDWNPIMEWWDKQWDKAFDSVADMVNQVTPLLRGLGFDVGNMRKGVFKTFDRGDQYIALHEKLAKFQKYGAPEDPNAEPYWLTKNPANNRFPALGAIGSKIASSSVIEGRMAAAKKSQGGAGFLDPAGPLARGGLVGMADKLGKGSGGAGGTGDTYTFAPHITVHPGTPGATQEAVGASVQEMHQMFERWSKEQMAETRRRSFGQ